MSVTKREQMNKSLLSKIYLQSLYLSDPKVQLEDNKNKHGNEIRNLILEPEDFGKILDEMEKQKMIQRINSNEFEITDLGRKQITVVMAGGTFDIIHPGHIDTLEQARELGDVLVVSVARNSTVQKNKRRPAVHDEQLRQKLVESIKFVDAAVLGSEIDIFETVDRIKPDIIALGYDQYHTEKAIVEGCTNRNLKLRVVRLKSKNPKIKTKTILDTNDSKILDDL
jgi:cytidyltransferase-like protein